jgi:hypothetical protein
MLTEIKQTLNQIIQTLGTSPQDELPSRDLPFEERWQAARALSSNSQVKFVQEEMLALMPPSVTDEALRRCSVVRSRTSIFCEELLLGTLPDAISGYLTSVTNEGGIYWQEPVLHLEMGSYSRNRQWFVINLNRFPSEDLSPLGLEVYGNASDKAKPITARINPSLIHQDSLVAHGHQVLQEYLNTSGNLTIARDLLRFGREIRDTRAGRSLVS